MFEIYKIKLILTGTGINISELRDRFASKAVKENDEKIINRFDDFLLFQDFKNYVRVYLSEENVSDTKLESLHLILKGRVRLTAFFIVQFIINNDIDKALKIVHLKAEEFVHDTISKKIATKPVFYASFMGKMGKFLFKYFYLNIGTICVLNTKDKNNLDEYAMLIELGIALTKPENGKITASIEEPIVASILQQTDTYQAEMERYIMELFHNHTSASSKGNEFENVMAYYFLDVFNKGYTIKGIEYKLAKYSPEGSPLACLIDKDKNKVKEYMIKPEFDLIIIQGLSLPDLIFRATINKVTDSNQQAIKQEVLVMVQIKLREDDSFSKQEEWFKTLNSEHVLKEMKSVLVDSQMINLCKNAVHILVSGKKKVNADSIAIHSNVHVIDLDNLENFNEFLYKQLIDHKEND